MRSEMTLTIVTCDNCQKRVPEEDAAHWFRLEQARSEPTPDKLSRLTFCQPSCVAAFLDKEVFVSYLDESALLGADNSFKLPIRTYLKAYM